MLLTDVKASGEGDSAELDEHRGGVKRRVTDGERTELEHAVRFSTYTIDLDTLSSLSLRLVEPSAKLQERALDCRLHSRQLLDDLRAVFAISLAFLRTARLHEHGNT